MWTFLAFLTALLPQSEELPVLVLDRDDIRAERSARVVVPPGTVIADANGNGVLHVVADGVRLEFAPGSVLRGAPPGTAPDRLEGIGVRVDGVRDVEIIGARVHGFRVGLRASRADGLLLEGLDVSDNYAQRLRSSAATEDVADWLRPHANDSGEWRERYGAGISIERSAGATVRGSRARRTQNGLILSHCSAAQVYDSDFSFLSGWGVALWRTSDSLVSRNALDFCVRGYSHGVYNRGQDSAGLLMFEQCSRNLIAENSITHGGDGIFGFAGLEALGEGPAPEDFDHRRAGCNDNLFLGNDLSYAAAHGLELTFSFGNVVEENRFHGNAICGLWGGYSREMVVARNDFEANGERGYGLERGAIDVEHAGGLWIEQNRFRNNVAGVHLWWRENEKLHATPWARANGVDCAGAWLVENRFEGDALALHLQRCQGIHLCDNVLVDVGEAWRLEEAEPRVLDEAETLPARPERRTPEPALLGETRPVGARSALAGREHIVMGEWGPWDHASPLLRRLLDFGGMHVYELRGAPDRTRVQLEGEGILMREHRDEAGTLVIRVGSEGPGVRPYTLAWRAPAAVGEIRGFLFDALWEVTLFPSPVDPREDLEGWRAGALSPRARSFQRQGQLRLQFGPSELSADHRSPPLAREHFGTLARTRVALPAGSWRIATLSDDGLRVLVNGETLLEDWTHHAPRRHETLLELAEQRELELLVEHFQLDGHAVLELTLEPADAR